MLLSFFISVFYVFQVCIKSENVSHNFSPGNGSKEEKDTNEQIADETDENNNSMLNERQHYQKKYGFIGDMDKMHEIIHSGFQFNETPGACDDGLAYMFFESCMIDCERRNAGLIKSGYFFSDPYEVKVLFLRSNEFKIRNDHQLEVLSMNISIPNDSYVLFSNGTARACLPLIGCNLWETTPGLLEFYENGSMWHKELRRYYDWGEFSFIGGFVSICEPIERENTKNIFEIQKIGNLISTVCLWVAVILSRFITHLKKNIVLQCHIIMLASAFIVATYRSFHADSSPNLCIIISALHQFFSLSAFFWINVQSFDLLLALKRIQTNNNLTLRRFLAYSAFAWGIPVILTTFAVTAEISEHPDLKPGFKLSCYFLFGTVTSFGYYFGWMGLSIFVNLLLFLLIAFLFKVLQKSTQEVNMVRKNSLRKLFGVSAKLVFAMDVLGIFSVIAWIANDNINIWYLNLMSSLLGVIVFLIIHWEEKYLK